MKFRPGVQVLRFCLGFVVTAISTVACTPAPDRARFSIQAYRENPGLRALEVKRCANDATPFGKTWDCMNAREAERLETAGNLRRLPPLDLPMKRP